MPAFSLCDTSGFVLQFVTFILRNTDLYRCSHSVFLFFSSFFQPPMLTCSQVGKLFVRSALKDLFPHNSFFFFSPQRRFRSFNKSSVLHNTFTVM